MIGAQPKWCRLQIPLRIAQLTVDTPPSPLQQHLRVSELHYNPSGDDATEFLELWNTSRGPNAVTLDLSGVILADGPSDPFAIPAGTELSPGDFLVIAKDPYRLQQAYPNIPTAQILGPFAGSFSNGGETIQVNDAAGRALVQFTYDDESPWPTAADGDGYCGCRRWR